MRKRYEIVDWERHYEVAQSRKSQKHSWVAIPNKHDGKGFARLAMQPEAPELFAAWVLIIQLASKMPERGILSDNDGPLSISDMALKTRFSEKIFQKAIDFFTQKDIAWMRISGSQSQHSGSTVVLESHSDTRAVVEQSQHSGSTVVARYDLHDNTEHDNTEHNNTKPIIVSDKPKQNNVQQVFDYWATVMGHQKARLDTKRQKTINSALKIGYSVADLKQAIDGNKASKWHQGQNKDKKVFDSLDLILRNAEQIDKFIALADGRGTNEGGQTVDQFIAEAEAQARRVFGDIETEKVVG